MGTTSVDWHACRIFLFQQVGSVGAVDVVHRDPQLTVVFASVVDPDDVGMAQSGGQVGLADEPLPERGVAGYVRAEDLQGLLAGQAGMLDQVDLAHTP